MVKTTVKALIASTLIITASGCAKAPIDYDGDGLITNVDMAENFREHYRTARQLAVSTAQVLGHRAALIPNPDDGTMDWQFPEDDRLQDYFELADQLANQHEAAIRNGDAPTSVLSNRRAAEIILNAINVYLAEEANDA